MFFFKALSEKFRDRIFRKIKIDLKELNIIIYRTIHEATLKLI
jgi:hypothetical protein